MRETNKLDILNKLPWPAGALSNFCEYHFVIDDVECASMEGFLQSLLISDLELQRQICQMIGIRAKLWGAQRLQELGETRRLWWRDKEYDRYSAEYQGLLDRAYDALLENEAFRSTLLSTENEILTHSIAHGEGPADTILTEQEFCSRLMARRSRLRRV